MHNGDKVIIYNKGKVYFAFNFHPTSSFDGYFIPVAEEGEYKVILSTDSSEFGGHNRADTSYVYTAEEFPDGRIGFLCYLPNRTALAFKKI